MTKKTVVGGFLAILAGFFILLGGTIPLLYASAAPAAHALGELTNFHYGGGPVLTNSFVYVVFWARDWQGDPNVQRIYSSIQAVINGGYFDALDQYGYGSILLTGYKINDVVLSSGQVISDPEFVNYANQLINSGIVPRNHSQIVFVLPTRHDVTTPIKAGGYHSYRKPFDKDPRSFLPYSVIQTGSLLTDFSQPATTLAVIMLATTHELVEAITDPFSDSSPSWVADGGEIADVCYDQTGRQNPKVGDISVSYYWSVTASQCVAGGGNGLVPIALSISGMPTDRCVRVKWSTNLQTFDQSACGSLRWYVRETSGSPVEIPTTITADSGTRYSLQSAITSSTEISIQFIKQYRLSVSTGYALANGDGWYNAGSTARVSLDRTILDTGPNRRVRFNGWTGDASGSLLPTQVFLDRPKSVTASWRNQFYLSIWTQPSSITTIGGEGWYDEGQSLVFDAPVVSEHMFLGWTLDGSPKLGSATIVMSAPHYLGANYARPQTFSQNVNIASSSAVSKFSYDSKNKLVSFMVSGQTGTLGFSTVRVPKNLLMTGSPTVKVDGQSPLLQTVSDEGSVWVMSFAYNHSDHLVTIPEFQSSLILILTIFAVIFLTRRNTKEGSNWNEAS